MNHYVPRKRSLPALAILMLLAPVPAGAETGSSPAKAAAPPAVQGACDPVRAKRVFAKCAICHVPEPGEDPPVGPDLTGVVGRAAGTARGFGYSRAMRSFGRRWTPAELDQFLTRPATHVPGTTMAFAGLRNPADRAAVICLLQRPGG